MAIDKCDWLDHRDIERWMGDWAEEAKNKSLDFVGKDDPLDEIRHRLRRGDFAGKNRASVAGFLAEQDAHAHHISDRGQADREERAVAAAEVSAAAAVKSARWAGWAIAGAIAALALAAWPYIKEWIERR